MADNTKKLIGQNYTTPDIVAKVTGKAKYAEDFRADGMLFAKLLLSPLPHARVSGLKSLVCAMGRIQGGVEFSALDKQPVYLVFLICYPPAQQTTYLNFLATLARLFRDPANMEAMLAATDEEELFTLLERVSAPMSEPEHILKQIKTDPKALSARDSNANLILLARLQMYQEMHDAAKSGKKQLKDKMDAIRDMVDPHVLKQYDKLMLRRAPAIVPVEGEIGRAHV